MLTTIDSADFNGPYGIAITLDGTKAYVTNNGNNVDGTGTTVSVINIFTNTVDTLPNTPITVGLGPVGIAIASVSIVPSEDGGIREIVAQMATLLGLNPQPNQGARELLVEIAPLI